MDKTLLPIRLVFIALCSAGGWLVCYTISEWDAFRALAVAIGFLIGVLVVLVDVLLKGFSLRGLSALTFGLFVGSLIAYMLSVSPLLSEGDPQVIYLVRLGLFLICTYLATVIALRGKDEFNLIIPYVRFVPHEVDVPLVVVDTSVLIDGRIARVCESGFLTSALVIPRFVLNELRAVADSNDPTKQARGRRGLEVLNELRKIKHLDIRITESEVTKREDVDAKLVFLAQSMRAKLLTTDYNLAKMAEFHGVPWLNFNTLARSLRPELMIGERIEVDLVKPGKEETQAVGFNEDGSMIVVNGGRGLIGRRVEVEIISVLPTAGGKMIFARHVAGTE
ncbi:PIN domain-containing protein [Opitutus sp. ER46]|uniref:PIN/TRAM domain-containing protein n=1 Tax=Opitutus sp. ER46 TaxID=2161864 RepID=UPI000D307E45|nr:PIN domain-containing protein [Opitutus sp. ER46]PTY01231.1 twitching motility protein PilT [Opitutus sp. ER46]